MKKKFTFLMAALMLLTMFANPMRVLGQTDVINNAATSSNLGNTATTAWASNFSINGTSGAIYYIHSMGTKNTSNALQWNSNGFLYMTQTATGKKLKSVTITTTANKNIGLYAQNTAYSAAPSGNALATIAATSSGATYTFTSDYTYLALKGTASSTSITSISIEWESTGPTQLAAPTNFSATAGNEQATFTWDAVEHASNYTIFAKNGNSWDNPTTLYNNVSLTDGQYVGTGLTNGTTYICKVRANGDGTTYSNSDLSDEYSVTPTGATQYTVTVDDNIAGGSVTASPTTAAEGTAIALTATANDGYGFTEWNVYKTGDQSTTVNVSNNSFEMPGYDVTVSASFTAYTVTLNAGNGSVNSTTWTIADGNLPNATPACDTWAFGGWSENAVNTQTTTAPTYVNTEYVPTQDITLYAVYTKTESGASFDGENGGDFLIYFTTSGDNPTTYYAQGTSSKLSTTTTVSQATTYTFEKMEGNGIFAIKSGSTYLSWSSGANFATSNSQYAWHMADGVYGTWRPQASGDNTRSIAYRTTNVFGPYSNSNINGTEYFDVEIGSGSTTYYNSSPSCTEQLATPTVTLAADNGSITPTWAAVSHASSYTLQYGTTSTFDENTYWSVTSATSGTAITANITNGTTYYLRVQAIGSGNYTDSEWSNVANATPVSVTTPTFSVDGIGSGTTGEYVEVAEVTITAPDYTIYNIYYTTDGSDPDNTSDQYDGTAIDIIETTTIKAIAYEGLYASAIGSITVNIAETTPIATVYAAPDSDDTYYIIDGIITYKRTDQNMFVEDDNAGILVYGSNTSVAAGDKVYIKGTKTTYNGKPELKNMTILGQYGTGTLPAAEISISDAGNYMYRRVKFTQVLVGSTSNDLTTISQGNNNIGVYKIPSVTNVTDEGYYLKNITGIVAYYNNANQMYVASADDITSYTIDATSNNTALGTVTTSGYVVTATPASGVVYDDPAYVEATSATVYDVQQTGNTFTIVTNGDMDIEIQFVTEAVLRNVTFSVNGIVDATLTREVVDGNPIGTLPSVSAPNGYVHMGWAATTISGVQANAPTMVTSETPVDDDMDLYAVFATGSTSLTYDKVAANASNIVEGTYLIAVNKVDSDNYNFANGQAGSGHAGVEATGVAVADSYLPDEIPEGAVEYTLSGDNDEGFAIYCSNGYLNGGDTKGSLSYGNTATETWVFSEKDDGFVLRGVTEGSKVSCNSPTAASAIRNYASTGSYYDPLYFFKKNETSNYTNYCTSVTDIADNENIENGTLKGDVTISSGAYYLDETITVPNGKTLTVNSTGVLVNNDVTRLIIEDGGQLIILNSNNDPVALTAKKTIANANSKDPKDHWYTISSSVHTGSNDHVTIGTTTTVNLTADDYDMFAYDEPYHYWRNQKEGNEASGFTVMNVGQGYLYRNSGNELSFVGNANFGEVTVDLSCSSEVLTGFNLIGNPYTHSIAKGSGKAIVNVVNENTEDEKTVLSNGCYVLSNSGTWDLITDGNEIKPNQGVLVETSAAVDNFQIKDINYVAPSKYNNDNLKFIVENADYSDAAYAWFDKGIGLTKINHRNDRAPMLYIPQDGHNYAIAIMSDDTKVFGLNFKAATMGQYTLSYKATGEYNYIHVIDRLTGEDVDMLLEDKYTFVATPNDQENRFIVKLGYTPDYSEGDNDIFVYQTGSEILVSGSGELQIFDVTGRKVMTTTINGAESVSVPAQGVYILRLVGNDIKTQKIVVR